jgi:hypothetical protein
VDELTLVKKSPTIHPSIWAHFADERMEAHSSSACSFSIKVYLTLETGNLTLVQTTAVTIAGDVP